MYTLLKNELNHKKWITFSYSITHEYTNYLIICIMTKNILDLQINCRATNPTIDHVLQLLLLKLSQFIQMLSFYTTHTIDTFPYHTITAKSTTFSPGCLRLCTYGSFLFIWKLLLYLLHSVHSTAVSQTSTEHNEDPAFPYTWSGFNEFWH